MVRCCSSMPPSIRTARSTSKATGSGGAIATSSISPSPLPGSGGCSAASIARIAASSKRVMPPRSMAARLRRHADGGLRAARRGHRRVYRGLTAPLAALALFLPGLPVAAAPLPDFPPAGTAQVKTVEADATLELADGRRLRLAGIDLPAHGALARQARDALSDLV